MMLYKIQKNKAFTLVELMVATTLFTIIMLMGVGSLVVSSNSAKASQKLRIAVDNVNFAMESMTRELRMGTYYYCDPSIIMTNLTAVKDCSSGDVIAFTPQKVGNVQVVNRVAYKLTPRTNDPSTLTLMRCEDSSPCVTIVSDDVNIKKLKFYVTGADETKPKVQPSVEILIKGEVNIKNKNMIKSFTLQTMSSQRSAEK